MVSKLRISVSRGCCAPYFSLMNLNQSQVTSTMLASSLSICLISSLIRAMFSSAFSLLNFRMRAIFISISRSMSSFVTSLTIFGYHGVSLSSIHLQAASMSLAFSNCLSLYILSSMKICSSEAKCNASSSSPLRIMRSLRSSSSVLSTLFRSTSLTVRKQGLPSDITQQLGEMLISQSVQAYRASMVLSLLAPGVRCISISALSDVRSSTLRILILPRSFAFSMLSMKVLGLLAVPVVLPYGIWVMASVLLSRFSILALTLTLPPLCPSLYLLTSMLPPVGKSG